MICVEIDELTPCLRDYITGKRILTKVLKVSRKEFLCKFTKKNGWYIDWAELMDHGSDIYALISEGDADVQGLIALRPVNDYYAVYVDWMVSAPVNNRQICEFPKYIGVGGHLFAIAINKSYEYGFNGVITGCAANENVMRHYIDDFGASYVGMLHPYQILIDEEMALRIKEVYDYEWIDDEL